ncbi:hypothetical protein F2Q70_00025817 [Brassica cretica]|uniref:Uncharacterized protein n=1 Tax=Brassica cretica TaxID=69181 RepID=A0A8S9L6X4_BRACR|nr:hypothetical protein F2Q70_00025817 [Brassica cretica]
MAATKTVDLLILDMFFRSGFGYAGFSDLEDFWDDLPVNRLKYNALEDFQDDLPGSLLTESSHMSPFHNRSERFVEDANPREEAFLARSTPAIQTTGRISIVASPVTAGFEEDTASEFSRIYARTSGLQEGESHDLHISGEHEALKSLRFQSRITRDYEFLHDVRRYLRVVRQRIGLHASTKGLIPPEEGMRKIAVFTRLLPNTELLHSRVRAKYVDMCHRGHAPGRSRLSLQCESEIKNSYFRAGQRITYSRFQHIQVIFTSQTYESCHASTCKARILNLPTCWGKPRYHFLQPPGTTQTLRSPIRKRSGSLLEGTPSSVPGTELPSKKWKTSDKENLPYFRIWKSLT